MCSGQGDAETIAAALKAPPLRLSVGAEKVVQQTPIRLQSNCKIADGTVSHADAGHQILEYQQPANNYLL